MVLVFQKLPNFIGAIFSKKKKKATPEFVRSIRKKALSPIGQALLEKKGENLVFYAEKLIFAKTQEK